MGGTFDPIHHGHLVAASEVAHFFSLDEVIFVPTGQPWQKEGRKVSASEDRYLMTVIATASNPRFSVSRVDIDRPGPTYTIDTLRDLRLQRGPGAEFFFITGADALEQMMTWQDADELFKLAHFVGCTRPGHHLSGAGLPDDRVSLIEVPALAISSTNCRQRVGAGEPIWYLVPDETPGELVFSTVTKEALPLLRYRTGDIAALRRGPCACGRTLVKMSKVTGRRDDMLVLRGVNVYPSEVERVLLAQTALAADYLLVLDERESPLRLLACVEYRTDSTGPLPAAGQLESRLREELGVSVMVRLLDPGTVPRTEVGKAVRIRRWASGEPPLPGL